MSHWRPSSFLRLQAFTDVLVRWLASLDVSSTHPRGARHQPGRDAAIAEWFQSTRPRGSGRDNRSAWLGWLAGCFNPRAHAGRDPALITCCYERRKCGFLAKRRQEGIVGAEEEGFGWAFLFESMT